MNRSHAADTSRHPPRSTRSARRGETRLLRGRLRIAPSRNRQTHSECPLAGASATSAFVCIVASLGDPPRRRSHPSRLRFARLARRARLRESPAGRCRFAGRKPDVHRSLGSSTPCDRSARRSLHAPQPGTAERPFRGAEAQPQVVRAQEAEAGTQAGRSVARLHPVRARRKPRARSHLVSRVASLNPRLPRGPRHQAVRDHARWLHRPQVPVPFPGGASARPHRCRFDRRVCFGPSHARPARRRCER